MRTRRRTDDALAIEAPVSLALPRMIRADGWAPQPRLH